MATTFEEFDRLCRSGSFFGPVDDLTIEGAELELGVRFPSEYSDLLRTYGAILAPGIAIYGLPATGAGGPSLWQSVVSVTKQLREWKQLGAYRNKYIVISEDDFGNYIYLDTSVSPKTRICVLGPGVEKVFDTSLFTFFLNFSRGNLAF
ncbi:SMI1/KNR4 family protein [Croceibacterium sp. LX-88]|uniref:SMI1/KNR4 family protein n=1 Tax=Croceibacterium selenioxidans TaxID=2838833 RepID=A0ABS5W6L1_9SPHN|nr:SMI1/KNR4 family protein [Croceibacterium selenioxidans]MBT2134742.1 SMI1/KNR4 family protein [Croceibacterium selenioxidans]